MAAARPSSPMTASDSGWRRYEPPSPIRSRKRRYSWKQPSAMCWPLSGGGEGSPSRSGSVCTAPPSVGRASWSVTSCPASTSSSAADRPARPPPTTAALIPGEPSSQETPRGEPGLAASGEARRAAEDVEAGALDAVERGRVEQRERADAGGAAAVEVVEQRQPVLEVRPRPRRLVRHQRLPGRAHAPGGDVGLGDAVRGELVLREVDAAELPVLGDVAHDVDQLERDPERLRALRLVGAVDGHAGDADGAGDAAAVLDEPVEVVVAAPVEVHQPAVDQVVERLRRDREASPRVRERDPHRGAGRARGGAG